ncbi:hypothetical protein VPMS16_2194 [Vibrio sp. 16]|nr:hypothetical protein VPMS16_2194 [Vibrio sp. 16]
MQTFVITLVTKFIALIVYQTSWVKLLTSVSAGTLANLMSACLAGIFILL